MREFKMSNGALVAFLSVAMLLFPVPLHYGLATCWYAKSMTEPAQYSTPCNNDLNGGRGGCTGYTRTQIYWQECAVTPTNIPGWTECRNSLGVPIEDYRVGYAYLCTNSWNGWLLTGLTAGCVGCMVVCYNPATAGLACYACAVAWGGGALGIGPPCGYQTVCGRDDDTRSAIYKMKPVLDGSPCQNGG